MSLTATYQQHLRVDSSIFQLLQQVTRFSKDLYNSALYLQRQQFFSSKSILSLGNLFAQVKTLPEYLRLPSDLAQQILILVNQNFSSFFKLLKKKRDGNYKEKVRLPYYLDKDGHQLLTFISRLFRFDSKMSHLRLSLGHRGNISTGTRYIFLKKPTIPITPKQIRIIPRYKALYFDIEYVYDIDPLPRPSVVIPDSYLSIDLGLNNFATCATSIVTAFIIEGSGIKSFNRWWNKVKARYQSRINQQGITGMTKRMAHMQQYRRNVMNNFLNHVVRNIIDHCLQHGIETIVVGDWKDMKRRLKMRRKVGQLFQTIPYGWFKTKLAFKAELHDITFKLQEESYTSQDCFNCGLRRKANRRYRGLYRCSRCGMQLNADVNGALNIMKKVAPKSVCKSIQWSSGEITSPSRIRLVEFV